MIPEYLIITTQLFATFLMAYDYFLSDQLKDKVDGYATGVLENAQVNSNKKLGSLNEQKRKFFPYFYALLIFIYFSVLLYLIMQIASTIQVNIWVTIALALVWLFFIAGTMQGVVKWVGESVGPLSGPYLWNLLLKFLAYSPKKSIAATGIIFLGISFLLRYINAF